MGQTADVSIVVRAEDDTTESLKRIQSAIIRFAGAVSAALAIIKTTTFPVAAAAEFQKELLNVAKTANSLSENQIKKLGDDLIDLSTKTNTAAVDLAKIAAIAGQLGLSKQGPEALFKFTEAAARFSAVVGISAEAAANSIAKIDNVFGIAIQDSEKVSAAINEISNQSTASGKDLLDVINRLGTAGGLTFAQATAFAAAARDFGTGVEVAGTSGVKIFSNLQIRAAEFAKFMGVSTAEWTAQVQRDTTGAFLSVLASLNKVDNATADLFIQKNFGSGRIFAIVDKFRGELARVGDTAETSLSKYQRIATSAFDAGTSSIKEQDRVLTGFLAQLDILKNSVTKSAINVVNDKDINALQGLTDVTKELSKAVQSTEAQDFLKGIALSVKSAAEEVAGLVRKIGTLGVSFDTIISVAKVFVGLSIGKSLLGLSISLASTAGKVFSVGKNWAAATQAVKAYVEQSQIAAATAAEGAVANATQQGPRRPGGVDIGKTTAAAYANLSERIKVAQATVSKQVELMAASEVAASQAVIKQLQAEQEARRISEQATEALNTRRAASVENSIRAEIAARAELSVVNERSATREILLTRGLQQSAAQQLATIRAAKAAVAEQVDAARAALASINRVPSIPGADTSRLTAARAAFTEASRELESLTAQESRFLSLVESASQRQANLLSQFSELRRQRIAAEADLAAAGTPNTAGVTFNTAKYTEAAAASAALRAEQQKLISSLKEVSYAELLLSGTTDGFRLAGLKLKESVKAIAVEFTALAAKTSIVNAAGAFALRGIVGLGAGILRFVTGPIGGLITTLGLLTDGFGLFSDKAAVAAQASAELDRYFSDMNKSALDAATNVDAASDSLGRYYAVVAANGVTDPFDPVRIRQGADAISNIQKNIAGVLQQAANLRTSKNAIAVDTTSLANSQKQIKETEDKIAGLQAEIANLQKTPTDRVGAANLRASEEALTRYQKKLEALKASAAITEKAQAAASELAATVAKRSELASRDISQIAIDVYNEAGIAAKQLFDLKAAASALEGDVKRSQVSVDKYASDLGVSVDEITASVEKFNATGARAKGITDPVISAVNQLKAYQVQLTNTNAKIQDVVLQARLSGAESEAKVLNFLAGVSIKGIAQDASGIYASLADQIAKVAITTERLDRPTQIVKDYANAAVTIKLLTSSYAELTDQYDSLEKAEKQQRTEIGKVGRQLTATQLDTLKLNDAIAENVRLRDQQLRQDDADARRAKSSQALLNIYDEQISAINKKLAAGQLDSRRANAEIGIINDLKAAEDQYQKNQTARIQAEQKKVEIQQRLADIRKLTEEAIALSQSTTATDQERAKSKLERANDIRKALEGTIADLSKGGPTVNTGFSTQALFDTGSLQKYAGQLETAQRTIIEANDKVQKSNLDFIGKQKASVAELRDTVGAQINEANQSIKIATEKYPQLAASFEVVNQALRENPSAEVLKLRDAIDALNKVDPASAPKQYAEALANVKVQLNALTAAPINDLSPGLTKAVDDIRNTLSDTALFSQLQDAAASSTSKLQTLAAAVQSVFTAERTNAGEAKVSAEFANAVEIAKKTLASLGDLNLAPAEEQIVQGIIAALGRAKDRYEKSQVSELTPVIKTPDTKDLAPKDPVPVSVQLADPQQIRSSVADQLKDPFNITVNATVSGGGGVQANARGGPIRGAGGPKDDKILSWLSNGEFVMDAHTTGFFGTQFFKGLQYYARAGRSFKIPGFASGGMVGTVIPTKIPTDSSQPAVASSQDIIDINLNFGGQTMKVSGRREDALRLRDAINRIRRG